ncbi:MAG: HAMP domain-containing histidine kinase, partial [Spirochaetales bacterium]|nr:HAMP domain-containing histidine kinase [Spirochaetales bacterium]
MSESIMVSHSGLESEVEKRTKELEKSQKQLILLERMANLGGLVAGVSHEINTPLGIIVTSASFMNDEVRNLNKNFENGHLTKALFNDFCNNATESSSLILSNSRRASDLIKSFKKVAVDQASDDKRVFKIGLYTQEIYTSLYHKFKKTAIDVNIHYETDIDVNSYPGAYSQVITNLLMNSLFHGFPVTKEGKIDIGIEHIDDNVKIIYTDNGEGISEEHLAKIFNPFFTTKRDEGGSGLGLNIVYNIVTQKLNGDVLCDSKKGEYTTFKITFPIINETTEL